MGPKEGSKRMSWDKVITSSPVDRIAVWVTKFKAWDKPSEAEGELDQQCRVPGEAPQHVLERLAADEATKRRWRALIAKSPYRLKARPPSPDLTGQVVGNLLVIGAKTASPDRSNASRKRGALWVAVCSCGAYVLRRRKSLEAGNVGGCGPGCDAEHQVKVERVDRGRTRPRWMGA